MKKMLDALWRAAAYCLYPPVMTLSLVPLLVLMLAGLAFAFWGWEPAVAAMQSWVQGSTIETLVLRGLSWMGLGQHTGFLPKVLVLFIALPLIVVGCLLIVTWLTTPAIVRILSRRRFPGLEQKHGGNLLASAVWSTSYTLLACGLMLLSLPLWLLPPVALLAPPLIWGWLAARLLPFDVLAEHASVDERRTLFKRHRFELLTMGIVTGLLGSAPSLLWASGALFIGLFVILVPVAIWMYTLVFVFSTLWFGHFCLRALELLRQEQADPFLPAAPAPNGNPTPAGALPPPSP